MKKLIYLIGFLFLLIACSDDEEIISPKACFTYSVDTGSNAMDKYVSFINCSENADDYTWNFGDGNISTETNPTHYYSDDNEFIVTLTASNNSNSDIATDTINVNWTQPKACFTFSYEGEVIWETYIVFTNCSENAISYLWDFGDGNTSVKENPDHDYMDDGEYIVELKAFRGSAYDTFTDTVLVYWTQVDKPNIYIYPETEIDILVELFFPLGGHIVKSIPEYGDGWNVNVDETGLINDTYNYLFYEAVQPDIWQYEKGWCIKKDSLRDFFEMNMNDYNFSENEINDFTEYWIPLLDGFNYFYIYPQTNYLINKVIELRLSEMPDNIGRLFYGIIGSNEYKEIPESDVESFNREGFTVMEWGVFRK